MPDPNFLGIGAQKAGTTWLYFALAHHPEILMPDCKEVHFWDQNYTKGYGWYEVLFRSSQQKTVGEITPAYGILPPRIIAEIAEHYPKLRLIAMIREPKARAWSAALMDFRKTGLDYESTTDAWFLEHFRSEGSRRRGDYETCIRNWLEHFPKKQLLILDYTAIKTNPRGMLKRVAKHLSIDEKFFDVLAEKHLTRTRNEGSGHKIRLSLQVELETLYAGKYAAALEFIAREKLQFFTS